MPTMHFLHDREPAIHLDNLYIVKSWRPEFQNFTPRYMHTADTKVGMASLTLKTLTLLLNVLVGSRDVMESGSENLDR